MISPSPNQLQGKFGQFISSVTSPSCTHVFINSIKVHAVALNPVDALYVAHPSDKPGRVVGSDIAGVVDKIGNGVTKWKLGDRVAGLLQGGKSDSSKFILVTALSPI